MKKLYPFLWTNNLWVECRQQCASICVQIDLVKTPVSKSTIAFVVTSTALLTLGLSIKSIGISYLTPSYIMLTTGPPLFSKPVIIKFPFPIIAWSSMKSGPLVSRHIFSLPIASKGAYFSRNFEEHFWRSFDRNEKCLCFRFKIAFKKKYLKKLIFFLCHFLKKMK